MQPKPPKIAPRQKKPRKVIASAFVMPEVRDRIDSIAQKSGTSRSHVLEILITEAVQQYEI